MASKPKPNKSKGKAPRRRSVPVKRPVKAPLDRYVPDEEDVKTPERINPEDLKFIL